MQPCHAVGLSGESPNRKAPPFRSLHARHPSLALREPLSRGIAAPNDEMPRFTLSGPEIGSIVAYINSLATTTSMQPPSSVKAQPKIPIVDAVDIGDARKGLSYAQKICSACHNVLRTESSSPNAQAPPFKADCEYARHVHHRAHCVVADIASDDAQPSDRPRGHGRSDCLHLEPAGPLIYRGCFSAGRSRRCSRVYSRSSETPNRSRRTPHITSIEASTRATLLAGTISP